MNTWCFFLGHRWDSHTSVSLYDKERFTFPRLIEDKCGRCKEKRLRLFLGGL